MYCPSVSILLAQFEHERKNNNNRQRLGQYFACKYIKEPSHELLFIESDKAALLVINEWLIAHQYINELPIPLHYMTSS